VTAFRFTRQRFPSLTRFCNVDLSFSREYYPQNIMYDKRVHRGNSYAAMVIPAGTSHDTMIMEKRQTQKAASLRNGTFKSTRVSAQRQAHQQLLGPSLTRPSWAAKFKLGAC
jgi:hypothetical protein